MIEKLSNRCSLVELDVKGKTDGFLIPVEGQTSVCPFEIKRIYYIYGVKESLRRGFHAHKALKQLLIATSGAVSLDLDNGFIRASVRLKRPSQGVLIEGPIWREMYDFSNDCTLLVLASEKYDEDDYIHSYRDFKTNFGDKESIE